MTTKEYQRKLRATINDKIVEVKEDKDKRTSEMFRFGFVGFIEGLEWVKKIMDKIEHGVEG